jgi:hypothetical protein
LPESHSFHGASAQPPLALGSGPSLLDVTTASARCLALMVPRRHTRPSRRMTHCEITPLACSDPWQQPKRSGFFDPVSAISFKKVDVARLTSPNAPTEMHMTCFMEASWVSTGPGAVSGVVSLKAASVSFARARYWAGTVAPRCSYFFFTKHNKAHARACERRKPRRMRGRETCCFPGTPAKCRESQNPESPLVRCGTGVVPCPKFAAP